MVLMTLALRSSSHFLNLRFEFIEFHTIWVLDDLISGSSSPSVGGPNEEVVT